MSTDKIELEVDLQAPVDRVWALVSEPGWWVGDGDTSGRTRSRDGSLEIVDDPKYGRFPVRVEATGPRHYAAYRWAPWFPGTAPEEGNSTLVEFWVTEEESGARLRVVESGFAGVTVPGKTHEEVVEGNVDGWRSQFGIAKEKLESAG